MMTRELFVRYLLVMMLREKWIVLIWQELIASGRLRENEAHEVAYDLTYGLAKSAYKL